jgi:cardiolipin synthase
VDLLVDGPDTLSAIYDGMRNARREIYLETYILADDDVGEKLAQEAIAARRRGVVVRIIVDAAGSIDTDDDYHQQLSDAGIALRKFNPVNPLEDPRIWRINNRTHRKLIIIDGETVFLGGINFSGEYSSSSSSGRGKGRGKEGGLEGGWRDSHLQLDGPVAGAFRDLFLENWSQTGDPIPEAERLLPTTRTTLGSVLVRPLAGEGGDEEYVIYDVYRSAVQHAEHRIWLTHAYFSPDKAFLEDLEQAARRGVDVRLLLPGFIDFALVFHASRSNYDRLLVAGVRIFERTDALLHAKTAVIDGVWSTVGSANLDMRSFIHNSEVNAVVVGRDFGRRMEELFRDDLAHTEEITLATWRDRSVFDRLKEQVCKRFNYWL